MISNPESIREDLTLIHQTLQGNPNAFRKIIEKYQDYIYDLCLRILNHPQDAEDISQEAFLKLYRQLSNFKAGYKLSNWLYTIALNLCRNHLRRKKIIRFFSLDHSERLEEEEKIPELPSGESSVEEKMTEAEEEMRLNKMIRLLPDSYRNVFILRYLREMREEEISQILGISLSNVRVRIHRAKIYLWKKLQENKNKV